MNSIYKAAVLGALVFLGFSILVTGLETLAAGGSGYVGMGAIVMAVSIWQIRALAKVEGK